MLTILIIGSDSFIATQFYNSLADKSYVKLYSRVSSGKANEITKDLFKINEHDFENVDVVLNFAAIVHQPKLKDDLLYNKINTELPIHLANEAKKADVKHFIQMSTIAVYGNVEVICETTPANPSNIYGISKLDADIALLSMHNESFKVSIVRPPMVYGGGLAPGNMQKLIRFAMKGFPLPFAGVKNERDFIHVGNLVDALTLTVESGIYGVILPTDCDPFSTERILLSVKESAHQPIWLIKVPKTVLGLIKTLSPAVYSKTFGNLRVECNISPELYKPRYSVDDGIIEMVQAIQNEKHSAKKSD